MLLRSLGHVLVPVMAALLVLTTPIGTGQGVHASELLHPVLPHVHLVDGRIVTDEQLAAAGAAASADVETRSVSGPAIGAGTGADAAGLGLALGPILPLLGFALVSGPDDHLVILENTLPEEFRDAPQDPPPNRFA